MILGFVTFILKDPNYYNEDKDKLAGKLGVINSIAEVCVIFQDLYIGLIQDAFGRKVPLIISILVLGGAVFSIPLFNQLYPDYLVIRSIISLALIVSLNIPLLPDYVSHHDMGLANGYIQVVITFACVIA